MVNAIVDNTSPAETITRGSAMRAPRVAIAGISGYGGGELARLLLRHPRFREAELLLFGRPGEAAASTETRLAELHPQVTADPGYLVHPFNWDVMAEHGTELLLLATPHDQSREWAPIAIERGIRVIDLSGAWRLQHPTHRGVYKLRDADAASANDLQREAVYGSPELHKQEIAQARLVANPGCYATSIILPLAPLLRAGMADLEYGIICDAKSGVSGAGKGLSPKTHFMYAADNLSAYNVFGHRHTGELVEQLGVPADHIQFTPHLLPIPRGILSTIYLRLREPSSTRDVLEVMRTFFRDAPFVRVRDAGVLPQIQYVTRTNFCDIGLEVGPDGRRVVLISCLDNLLKGAAGQAIQNLNLMYGWGETEGLL